MVRNTYDNARKQTIAYALAQGYTMIEDGCHMESPRGINTVKAQARRMWAILTTTPDRFVSTRVWIDGPSGHQSEFSIRTVADCERVVRSIRRRARSGERVYNVVKYRHGLGMSIETTHGTPSRCPASTPGRQWAALGRVAVGKTWGYARPEHQGVNTP